jgi:hypothetical protein
MWLAAWAWSSPSKSDNRIASNSSTERIISSAFPDIFGLNPSTLGGDAIFLRNLGRGIGSPGGFGYGHLIII